MKKIKSFNVAVLLLSSILLFSSCSNQLYSYRDKVSVKKETEIVKNQAKSEIIESKKAKIKTETIVVPKTEQALAQQTKPAETAKIENIIKENLPASGSKSSFKSLTNEVKNVKKQFKSLHKELKKQDIKEKQALVSNPIKWMVLGLILIVVGAILGLIVGAGGFVAYIGLLIFLIGLLFWLLEMI